MKTLILCLTTWLTSFVLSAQSIAFNNEKTLPSNFNPNSARKEWKIDREAVEGRIARKQLNVLKNRVLSILKLLSDSCFINNQYESPLISVIYGRGPNQIRLELSWEQSNTRCSIVCNDLGALLEPVTLNGEKYFFLRTTDAKEARSTIEAEKGNDSVQTKTWMVSGADQVLPYVPVSKSDYLNSLHAVLTLKEKETVQEVKESMPLRTVEEQEDWKKAQIERLKQQYTGANLEVRVKILEANFKPDELVLEEEITSRTAELKTKMESIKESLAALTREELNRPMFVSADGNFLNGFGEGPGKRMLVKPSSSFFFNPNSKFYVVSCMYNQNNPSILDHLNPALLERALQ